MWFFGKKNKHYHQVNGEIKVVIVEPDRPMANVSDLNDVSDSVDVATAGRRGRKPGVPQGYCARPNRGPGCLRLAPGQLARNAEIGKFIHRLRKAYGLTQKDVADIIGIGQPRACRLESGEYPIKTEELVAIFNYFRDDELRKI